MLILIIKQTSSPVYCRGAPEWGRLQKAFPGDVTNGEVVSSEPNSAQHWLMSLRLGLVRQWWRFQHLGMFCPHHVNHLQINWVTPDTSGETSPDVLAVGVPRRSPPAPQRPNTGSPSYPCPCLGGWWEPVVPDEAWRVGMWCTGTPGAPQVLHWKEFVSVGCIFHRLQDIGAISKGNKSPVEKERRTMMQRFCFSDITFKDSCSFFFFFFRRITNPFTDRLPDNMCLYILATYSALSLQVNDIYFETNTNTESLQGQYRELLFFFLFLFLPWTIWK